MERHRISDKEQMIKRFSPDEDYDDFDVKASVMERVRAIHRQRAAAEANLPPSHKVAEPKPPFEPEGPVMQKQNNVSSRTSPRRRKILTGVCAAGLLAMAGFGILQFAMNSSLPEQSSQPDIEIIKPLDSESVTLVNSGGKVVLETVENATLTGDSSVPATSAAAEKYQSLLQSYTQQVQTQLKPGEMAAYYVNDEQLNKLASGLGRGNRMYFLFEPAAYPDYKSFNEALKRAGATGPYLPPILLDGYEFEQGVVFAKNPYPPGNAEYQSLLQKFRQQVQSDRSGKKLFMEVLPWSSTGGEISYRKGSQSVRLTLMLDQFTGGNKILANILPGQSAEKWTLQGKEALFVSASSIHANAWYSQNRLYWYDEAKRMIFSLSDMQEGQLSKREWQEIAAGFIQ